MTYYVALGNYPSRQRRVRVGVSLSTMSESARRWWGILYVVGVSFGATGGGTEKNLGYAKVLGEDMTAGSPEGKDFPRMLRSCVLQPRYCCRACYILDCNAEGLTVSAVRSQSNGMHLSSRMRGSHRIEPRNQPEGSRR